MGAGSITSNVKSDKTLGDGQDTGRTDRDRIKKFGAMLGDECRSWLRKCTESGNGRRKTYKYLSAYPW